MNTRGVVEDGRVVEKDRDDFSDEQVAATIAGCNAFIDDIARELQRLQDA